jgi:hypothetical protein
MTTATPPATDAGVKGTIAAYLGALTEITPGKLIRDVLGYTDAERLSVNYKDRGSWVAEVSTPADAVTIFDALAGYDAWLGVNPVAASVSRGKRGSVEDVTRLAAVYADLDVKPGACRDVEHAAAIVAELAEILGSPSAVTFSGGGLQPYWAIAHGNIATDEHRATAVALLKRFGLLVAEVAENGDYIAPEHPPAKLDSVYDLPRVLRAPGTVNKKYGDPIWVRTYAVSGSRPLTVAELIAALDARGIPAVAATAPRTTTAAFVPVWAYADCSYATATVRNWAGDFPTRGRHQWHRDRAVRLAAMAAHGCLTPETYAATRAQLDADYGHLCEAGIGGASRPADYAAAERNHGRGEAIAAGKAPEELAETELGGHQHYSGMTGALDDFFVGGNVFGGNLFGGVL